MAPARIAITLLVLLGCPTAFSKDIDQTAAELLLAHSVKSYQRLSSLSSKGRVLFEQPGEPIRTTSFSMKLLRPYVFRIDWSPSAFTGLQTRTLWSTATNVFYYSQNPSSLIEAFTLDKKLWVSFKYSFRTNLELHGIGAQFFYGQIWASKDSDILEPCNKDFRYAGMTLCNKKKCYVIEQENRTEKEVTERTYFDADSMLVTKHEYIFGCGSTKVRCRSIEVYDDNQQKESIVASTLHFQPPQGVNTRGASDRFAPHSGSARDLSELDTKLNELQNRVSALLNEQKECVEDRAEGALCEKIVDRKLGDAAEITLNLGTKFMEYGRIEKAVAAWRIGSKYAVTEDLRNALTLALQMYDLSFSMPDLALPEKSFSQREISSLRSNLRR